MQSILLKLNLRLAALGQTSLIKMSQMAEITTLLLCVFIYLQLTSLVMTQKSLLNDMGFIGFLSILAVSFLCKLIVITTILIDTGPSLLKFSYFILQLSSGFFRCIDIVCFVSIIKLLNNGKIYQGLFSLSAINALLSVMLHGISEIIQFNYAFINPNPYKALFNAKMSLIGMILQISGFVIISLELPANLWFIRPLIQLMTVFFQAKCILADLPYNYDYLAQSNIIKMAFQFSMLFVSLLSNKFDIVGENKLLLTLLIIFLLSLSVFSVWKSRKSKILNQDIQEFTTQQMAFVKISWFSQLLQQTNEKAKTMLFLCYGSHQITCKDPTCPCKTKDKTLNFRLDGGAKDSVNQQKLNQLSLMYFLLSQAENAKKMFSESVCTHLLYLSSISLLHLYPSLFYQIKLINASFNLNLTDKSILKYILKETLDLINQNSKKKGMAFVEHIKIYQDSIGNLKKQIEGYCQNRVELWSLLRQPVIQGNKLDNILIADALKRKSICQLYDRILQNINTYEVWSLMYAYSHHITKDYKLQTKLVKENRKILNFSNFFQAPLNHARFLADHDNTCVIQISIDREKLGTIVWHSQHFKDLFKPTKDMLGHRIQLLMPSIYREHHAKILQKWLDYPVSTKIGKFNSVYIRSPEIQFMAAKIYIKVVTKIDNVELIGMVTKTDENQYLVIDEEGWTVNQPKQLLFLFERQNQKTAARINFCLISLNLLELLQRKPQGQKQLFNLEFIECQQYWQFLKKFQEGAQQLQQTHTNRQTYLKALQNLMKYYGTLIESSNGNNHQMRCQVRRIEIGQKIYTVLGFTRFERGAGQVNMTKMHCKTTVRGIDLASSTTTNCNEIVENRSSSIMSEQSDAAVKKDLLSTYMSKNLRILGFCSIFYLLSSMAVETVKYTKIDKDLQELLLMFDNYRIISEAGQGAQIAYAYATYLRNQPPQQSDWYSLRSADLLKQVRQALLEINNGEPTETLTTIEFIKSLRVPIKLNGKTETEVTYNVFFQKYIFECQLLLDMSNDPDNKPPDGLVSTTWYNYLRLNYYQQKANIQFKTGWTSSMRILILYFITGSSLFFLLNIVFLSHILYYIHKARKHHKSILETLMTIEPQNLSRYQDISSNHLVQIRKSVREFRMSEDITKCSIKSYNRVMYHSWPLVAHKIVLLTLVLIVPLLVTMPFVKDMKDNSLKLADKLAEMVDAKGQVNQQMVALVYQSRTGRDFTAQPGSEIIDFTKGFEESLLDSVRDIIEESKKYPEKKQVIALFSNNICPNHPFEQVCMNTQVLQTGLLSNLAMISHKLQDSYRYLLQDPKFNLDSSQFFVTIVKSAYHVHRQMALTIDTITQLIIKQPNRYRPVAQSIFILNIFITVSLIIIGILMYRKQKHSYHMKCMYLSVVPDDEFRFNVNLEILLSRIKQESYLEYN